MTSYLSVFSVSLFLDRFCKFVFPWIERTLFWFLLQEETRNKSQISKACIQQWLKRERKCCYLNNLCGKIYLRDVIAWLTSWWRRHLTRCCDMQTGYLTSFTHRFCINWNVGIIIYTFYINRSRSLLSRDNSWLFCSYIITSGGHCPANFLQLALHKNLSGSHMTKSKHFHWVKLVRDKTKYSCLQNTNAPLPQHKKSRLDLWHWPLTYWPECQ